MSEFTVSELNKENITNLYLYGQLNKPENLIDDSLIREPDDDNNLTAQTTVNVDAVKLMGTGPGRFAVPAQFELVQRFFNPSFNPTPGEYFSVSKSVLNDLYFGLRGISWQMRQVNYDDGQDNLTERAYIWNNMSFQIADDSNIKFVIESDGTKKIENFRAYPRLDNQDNFDFTSDGLAGIIGNFYLEPRIDPSHIGRTVNINFDNINQIPPIAIYTQNDFYQDLKPSNVTPGSVVDLFTNGEIKTKHFIDLPTAALRIYPERDEFIDQLFSGSKITRFLDSNNKPIIYGTVNGDNIFGSNVYQYPTLNPYKNNGVNLIGGKGNDTVIGSAKDDVIEGGPGIDELNGGAGEDVAVFTDAYANENGDQNYTFLTEGATTTVGHTIDLFELGIDGVDTLKNIEWGEFTDIRLPIGNARLASATPSAPRLIPLPLEDGEIETETKQATDTTPNPNINDLPTPPHVSLSAPVAMLDGNVDYTLNISPYKPDTSYNISYILDTSASMDSGELQAAKNAYTDLTNYFIDNGLAENINFGVVKFSRNATLYKNLTANQAISTIQGLTSSPAIEGTEYDNALYEGFNFLSQSPLNALNTTNISYFVSDGRSDISTNFYHDDAQRLRRFSNVQAFGIYDPLDPGGVTSSQINFVDSNNGVLVNNVNDLSTELQKSGLAGKVDHVNILVDDVVVDTIQASELTDSPLGLTYKGSLENEGSIENLDVSIDAENVITAEVVFKDNTATTSVDYTVTAGDGKLTDASGNPIDESDNTSGDEDPFEKIRNGGDSNDDITIGYSDRGANGGAGGDYIVGNQRDNQLDGGDGNDTIMGHGGNDTIITGTGTNKINGGEGIDTVVYGNVVYQGNNISLRQAANTVSYNNTDTLTEVEYIQFSDVRISAKTLAVVPILEVAEISITEGDSGNKTAQFTFNLSTPAPVDVVFDYSTADLSAVAGSDYVAKSGQITIPTGQTSATANVTINGDTTFEPNEEFGLTLSGISGATFKDNVTEYGVVATIANDDPVNYAPSSLGIPNTIVTTGAPNRSINLDDVFVDSEDNNSALTYSIQNNTNSALFDSVTIDQANRILLLDYQGNTTGTSELTVRATDSKGLFVDTTFTVSAISATSNNDTITGGDGNDYLDGNLGNDNLSGLSGDDTLTGGAGVDTLIGGAGNDLYIVDTATDTITENANEGIERVTSSVTYTLGAISNLENLTLTGNSAINATGNATNNALEGNSANNNLSGDAGNDTLIGGAGVDTLVGGVGNDLYTVDTATDTITENINEGTDTVASSVTHTLGANIENLYLIGSTAINGVGNTLNNTLTGNSVNNTLNGSTGLDTMIGGTGNDTYVVDNTSDVISEASATATEIDTVQSSVTYTLGSNLEKLTLTGTSAINGTGNSLNNTITGNTANNQLDGDTGNDTMTGGTGNDTYIVNSTGDVTQETSATTTEIDTVNALVSYTLGANVENLTLTGTGAINGTGNSLNNSITGNSTHNQIDGSQGNDTLVAYSGNDNLAGGVGDDSLNGGYGEDSLTGGTGNDSLDASYHNDTLDGGTGNDTMTGGTGNDTYIVDSTGDVTQETSATTTEIDTVNASVSYTLSANVENLTLTGTGAINGSGNSLNNTLTGNSTHNQIDGGQGNDTLVAYSGNDNLAGGAGDDSLNGGYGEDSLTGGTGNDSLDASYHNDTLDGGTGNDTMTGGTGNDTYVVDSTGDSISETSTSTTEIDTVQSSVTYTLGSNLENLTLTGTSAINGTGNSLNNTLTGNTANNQLDGSTGNDTMTGGTGNDTYIVDSTGDVTQETSATTTEIDTVNASVSYTLSANVENLTLTGTGAINGSGNSLNNTLTGNSTHNQIDGGQGNDTLVAYSGNDNLAGGVGDDSLNGGYGNDSLTGGAGNDTITGSYYSDRFIYDTNAAFSTSAVGVDRITDFTSGTDKMVLDKTTFTALGSVVGSGFSLASEFAVVGSDATAASVSALIVYSSDSGNLFYNQNGVASGLGSGAEFATLSGIPALSADDFVLQA